MDDLRMMREVVERWLKRQEEWPDVLLLDGGETHLNTIRSMLDEHGVRDRFLLAALAKREETLHQEGKDPIVLDRRGRVFVHARDEAHRFVNTFHRKRRKKSRLGDPLENVLGLGAKKLQSLLRHFGGRQGINNASIEDLKTVPGIDISRRAHPRILASLGFRKAAASPQTDRCLPHIHRLGDRPVLPSEQSQILTIPSSVPCTLNS